MQFTQKFLLALSLLLLPLAGHAEDYKVEEVELRPQPALTRKGEGDPKNAREEIGAALKEIHGLMTDTKVGSAGRPFVRTISITGSKWKYEVGIPVEKAPKLPKGSKVQAGSLPGGRVLKTLHKGNPAGYKDAFAALGSYLDKNKLVKAGPHWTVQLNDLTTVKSPDEFETEVFFPYKKGK